ncbi:MAG: carbohydrate kinase family protein [Sedimentisphaerales bacterium]|nr:carbohydrate kinase family protein [Sedimentisphaerales bacterium]
MKQTERNKAMVAGHICLDITPVFNPNIKGSFSTILSPGKLVNVGKAVLSTGGAVANTGLALAKLGIDVLLNGKVGDDEIGDVIKKLVGPQRAPSLRTVAEQASSYSVVLALPGVDRVFLHNPGTNDTFTAADVDYHALKDCSLFHFGYPTLMKQFYADQGEELASMFRQAKQAGAVTSMDVTLPDPSSPSGQVDWTAIFKKVLPWVDIFLPSVEEIAFMLDRRLFETKKAQAGDADPVLAYTPGDCCRMSEQLMDMGVAVVAIKNGIRGYYLHTAGPERLDAMKQCVDFDVKSWAQRQLWSGSYRADQFGSATGAGDATIAGFLTAFLKGLDPAASLKVANTVGWQNVRNVDAISGIEDWQTTVQMVSDPARPMNPLNIQDAGWTYRPAEQVFYGPSDCQ